MSRIQSHGVRPTTPVAGHKLNWKDEDMKSRLITGIAIGALAIGMLPGVASAADPDLNAADPLADGTSVITLTVDLGSTVIAPADFSVGSAKPGVSTVSDTQTLTWWSNEAALKDIYVTIGGDLTSSTTNTDIDANNVGIAKDAAGWSTYTALADAANAPQRYMLGDIQSVAFETDESADTQDFRIKVFVPQAAAASDYVATLNIATQDIVP